MRCLVELGEATDSTALRLTLEQIVSLPVRYAIDRHLSVTGIDMSASTPPLSLGRGAYAARCADHPLDEGPSGYTPFDYWVLFRVLDDSGPVWTARGVALVHTRDPRLGEWLSEAS